MRLLPLEAWFQPAPGPLLAQLRRHLAAAALARAGAAATPLRWAITAADPLQGLRIEAVLILEDAAMVQNEDSAPIEARGA